VNIWPATTTGGAAPMASQAAIMERLIEIDGLPTVCLEALSMMRDPQVSLDKLIGEVERDPALTGNLLRLANAAYFGFPREIGSVRQAIVRLGTRQMLPLILAAGVAARMNRPVRGYDLPPGALWNRSLCMAVGSVEVARRLGTEVPPELFTAGLLADVGKLVLGEFLAADGGAIRALAFEQGVPFDEAERRVLGLDHAEVGGQLLELWNLPEPIVDAVRHHHLPDQVGPGRGLVEPLHVADALCMMIGIGCGCDGLHYRCSPGCEANRVLQADAVEELMATILVHSRELGRQFEVVAEVFN